MKYYSGIGSRETPNHIRGVMESFAYALDHNGYILRSGNAVGADQSYAILVENAQIWLPDKNYNKDFQLEHPTHDYRVISDDDFLAYESIEKFHPAPKRLGDYAKKLMARNFRILKGLDEPDSEFVITWTDDGTAKGGSGQLMRAAMYYHIPVYNLYSHTAEEIIDSLNKMNLIN